MELEDRIIKYVEDHHIKYAPLARDMGMDANAFSLIMRRKRLMKASEFQNFCRALKVNPNDLFVYGD